MMLLLVLSGVSLRAQTSIHTDSEPNHITAEINRLEELRLSDPGEFSKGVDELSEYTSKMSGYQHCHYQFLRGYQKAFKGLSAEAVDLMESVVDECDDLRAKIRLNALIANISAIGGDYEKASSYIDQAINNAEQTSDEGSKGIAYSGASMVYNILNQHDLSAEYSELLFDIDSSSENRCRLTFTKNLKLINIDNKLPPFNEVHSAAETCKAEGHLVLSLSLILDYVKERLADENWDLNDLVELTEVLDGIQSDILNSPYKNLQASFTATQAKLYLLNNDYTKAKEFALRAVSLNSGLGTTEQLIIALGVLEKVAEKRGGFEDAYHYLKQKNSAELKIYDQSKSKQLAFMTVKHANLAKEFEIEQLNQQKAVLELEKKLAKQEANNQRLVILLILTLLALVLLWLFKIKKRHDYFKGVSEIDHLTKVLTRKAFEEQVHKALDASRAHKDTVNVAIMDLDHFKQVNDTHGHLIGDWVLKNVVYVIKEMMEANMMIARLGGEEFCVVMHGVPADVMMAKVEKMRQAIADFDCNDSGAELSVTASFGVTSSDVSGYNLPMLLTHADVALFEAKNKGRNRVVAFVPVNGHK